MLLRAYRSSPLPPRRRKAYADAQRAPGRRHLQEAIVVKRATASKNGRHLGPSGWCNYHTIHRATFEAIFKKPSYCVMKTSLPLYKHQPIVQQLILIDISNFLNIHFYEILHKYFFVRNQFLMRKNKNKN